MSKKIFFFDIDGTILQEQSMSKRVFDALNNIRKNGDYCFIASGRPPTFIPDIIKEVGFDGYILANGAYVEFNGNIINEEILDYNMLDELLKFLRETKNDYILQTKDACYLNKKYLNLYNFFKRIGLKVDEFIYEFDEGETEEAKFAYHCDKLECDLQCKLYDEAGCVRYEDQTHSDNHREDVMEALRTGSSTWSYHWLSYDRPKYEDDDNFLNVLDYAIDNKISKED